MQIKLKDSQDSRSVLLGVVWLSLTGPVAAFRRGSVLCVVQLETKSSKSNPWGTAVTRHNLHKKNAFRINVETNHMRHML